MVVPCDRASAVTVDGPTPHYPQWTVYAASPSTFSANTNDAAPFPGCDSVATWIDIVDHAPPAAPKSPQSTRESRLPDSERGPVTTPTRLPCCSSCRRDRRTALPDGSTVNVGDQPVP